jgi:hypothetical protein
MLYLTAEKKRPVQVFAHHLEIPHAEAQRAVQFLEFSGFLKKTTDPPNRKPPHQTADLYSLSQAGRELMEKVLEPLTR